MTSSYIAGSYRQGDRIRTGDLPTPSVRRASSCATPRCYLPPFIRFRIRIRLRNRLTAPGRVHRPALISSATRGLTPATTPSSISHQGLLMWPCANSQPPAAPVSRSTTVIRDRSLHSVIRATTALRRGGNLGGGIGGPSRLAWCPMWIPYSRQGVQGRTLRASCVPAASSGLRRGKSQLIVPPKGFEPPADPAS